MSLLSTKSVGLSLQGNLTRAAGLRAILPECSQSRTSMRAAAAAYLVPCVADALFTQLQDLRHIVLGIYLLIRVNSIGSGLGWLVGVLRGQAIAQLRRVSPHHQVNAA